VPLWLAGVQGRAVREEVRPKLKRFQLNAATVLYEAFQEGRLTADPAFDELQAADTPAAQAYRVARALMELARQQLILDRSRLRYNRNGTRAALSFRVSSPRWYTCAKATLDAIRRYGQQAGRP